MKAGILGSGIVGQVLAKAFASEGYDVMLGTRNTSKEEVVKFKNENSKIKPALLPIPQPLASLLVLAVKGTIVDDVIAAAGKNNFTGKVLIDATNPIADAPPVNGVLKFFTTPNDSLMERIQKNIPEAKVVKAFNSVGNTLMYKPKYKEGKPTMFICGNSDDAKRTVTDILTLFGYETEDLGKVEAARAIEPLCILWCIPGFIRNQWTHAFKLLKA